MPKYVIEREIEGAGNMSEEELQAVSRASCSVINNMKKEIEWIHSYVTQDKIYCVYEAPNQESVKEHAALGNFPANSIEEIRAIIDPTTANSKTTDR